MLIEIQIKLVPVILLDEKHRQNEEKLIALQYMHANNDNTTL